MEKQQINIEAVKSRVNFTEDQYNKVFKYKKSFTSFLENAVNNAISIGGTIEDAVYMANADYKEDVEEQEEILQDKLLQCDKITIGECTIFKYVWEDFYTVYDKNKKEYKGDDLFEILSEIFGKETF